MFLFLAWLRFRNLLTLQGCTIALCWLPASNSRQQHRDLIPCPMEWKIPQSEGQQVLPVIWNQVWWSQEDVLFLLIQLWHVQIEVMYEHKGEQKCFKEKARSTSEPQTSFHFLWLTSSFHWSNQYAGLKGKEGQFSLQKDLGMNDDKFRLIDPTEETSIFL